jgi:hypothetical protein
VFIKYDSAFSRRDTPEFCLKVAPSEKQRAQCYPERGAGKAGCPLHPRPRVQSVESTRVRHHRFTGTPGLPCAMVLTVSSALSSVTGLCCHRHRRNLFRRLDASVGASGPHDFAVREPGAFVNAPPHVHRIPPRVRDDRDTPPRRDGTARDIEVIWVGWESNYFCHQDWTASIRLIRLNKLSWARSPIGVVL